jgi:hypothetical protein
MSGPHWPNRGAGAAPPFTHPHPSQAFSGPPAGKVAPAAHPSAAYPRKLPPPVLYPRRNRRRLVIGAAVALALVAAMAAAIVYGARRGGPVSGGFSDATAKTAIQGYLDALENRDTDTIARNTLCGIYDAVADRQSDQALAKLSSDAFRKQFSAAQVDSIDRIVRWSRYQAQVLFTMRVTSTSGGPPHKPVQGIAQLLLQRNQILVCSYVPRTAGTFS